MTFYDDTRPYPLGLDRDIREGSPVRMIGGGKGTEGRVIAIADDMAWVRWSMGDGINFLADLERA